MELLLRADMSIYVLFWLLGAAALVAVWIHHNNLSHQAVVLARQHVRQQGLQFLDQSAVLCRVSIACKRWSLSLERTYKFEFSVRGDRRYNGRLTLTGRRLSRIELDPYPDFSPHPPGQVISPSDNHQPPQIDQQ